MICFQESIQILVGAGGAPVLVYTARPGSVQLTRFRDHARVACLGGGRAALSCPPRFPLFRISALSVLQTAVRTDVRTQIRGKPTSSSEKASRIMFIVQSVISAVCCVLCAVIRVWHTCMYVAHMYVCTYFRFTPRPAEVRHRPQSAVLTYVYTSVGTRLVRQQQQR